MNGAFNCKVVQVLKATLVGFPLSWQKKVLELIQGRKKKRQGLKFTGPRNSVLAGLNAHSEKSKGQVFPLVHVQVWFTCKQWCLQYKTNQVYSDWMFKRILTLVSLFAVAGSDLIRLIFVNLPHGYIIWKLLLSKLILIKKGRDLSSWYLLNLFPSFSLLISTYCKELGIGVWRTRRGGAIERLPCTRESHLVTAWQMAFLWVWSVPRSAAQTGKR